MFFSALIFLGFLAAVAGLSLAFFSQRYWFARAWRFAGRIQSPAWRQAMRGSLLVLLMVIAVTALTGITKMFHGTIFLGSWWTPLIGLWLSSSILSYVLIKAISGMEWTWLRMRLARLASSSAATRPRALDKHIDYSRRHFFQAAGFLAGAVPFVSFAYGFAEERFQFRVREIGIPVANLPPLLDGLRIAQLSDIHTGAYMPIAQVRRAVDMANELRSDLTVVTGDFITGRNDPLEQCIAELSRLRAPLGVWGCNGNHEIYAEAEAAVQTLFSKFGMRLLRQENAELRWQGAAFNLIGVDYQRQRSHDGSYARMLVGVEPLVRRDVPNILLSHNPNSFRRSAELGIELQLAGHTHGGQVRVEILDDSWSPARFLTPYVAGLYERPLRASELMKDADALSENDNVDRSLVYVNRGLGTIGAPIRLGVPPEISLLTLHRA
jgi:uncharacterized protein